MPRYHRRMQAAYPLLKMVHVGSAVVSLGLFVVRGMWVMASPQLLDRRWVKILPHAIDSVLLASAIALAVMIGNYPGTHGWLTAKLVGVVVYVVLGSMALKRGRTRAVRAFAFFAALAVFGYIVTVAITKSPAGPLPWL